MALRSVDYERKINRLIDEAEKAARARAKELGIKSEPMDGAGLKPYLFCFRTRFFHEEMNKRAFAAGLRPWK